MPFDPSKYVSKSVHGGVRIITGEEAKKIIERTRIRLQERKERLKQKCKLDLPDCDGNCGSYGCGN